MEQKIIGATAPVEELDTPNETDRQIMEIVYNEIDDDDTDGVILIADEPEGSNGVF